MGRSVSTNAQISLDAALRELHRHCTRGRWNEADETIQIWIAKSIRNFIL